MFDRLGEVVSAAAIIRHNRRRCGKERSPQRRKHNSRRPPFTPTAALLRSTAVVPKRGFTLAFFHATDLNPGSPVAPHNL